MGLFGNLLGPNLEQGLKEYQAVPGAMLLDVRTPEEYREGHLPGSRNLPLQVIARVEETLTDKTVPLFLYCHSGARSRRAAAFLQKIGYTNVTNIGGLAGYAGKLERE